MECETEVQGHSWPRPCVHKRQNWTLSASPHFLVSLLSLSVQRHGLFGAALTSHMIQRSTVSKVMFPWMSSGIGSSPGWNTGKKTGSSRRYGKIIEGLLGHRKTVGFFSKCDRRLLGTYIFWRQFCLLCREETIGEQGWNREQWGNYYKNPDKK